MTVPHQSPVIEARLRFAVRRALEQAPRRCPDCWGMHPPEPICPVIAEQERRRARVVLAWVVGIWLVAGGAIAALMVAALGGET